MLKFFEKFNSKQEIAQQSIINYKFLDNKILNTEWVVLPLKIPKKGIYELRMENNIKAIFKELGNRANLEEAAFFISEFFDIKIVPETKACILKINGEEKSGIMQLFVEKSQAFKDADIEDIPKEEFVKLELFYNLITNNDHHNHDNQLIKNNRIIAIDNAISGEHLGNPYLDKNYCDLSKEKISQETLSRLSLFANTKKLQKMFIDELSRILNKEGVPKELPKLYYLRTLSIAESLESDGTINPSRFTERMIINKKIKQKIN